MKNLLGKLRVDHIGVAGEGVKDMDFSKWGTPAEGKHREASVCETTFWED